MKDYRIPFELLDDHTSTLVEDKQAIQKTQDVIMDVVGRYFKNANMEYYNVGPTVTTFYITVKDAKSKKMLGQMRDELRLSLGGVLAHCYFTCVKDLYIEVPNAKRTWVFLSDVIKDSLDEDVETSVFPVTFGKDKENKSVARSLKSSPSILMQGSSASGKSNLLHAMIINMLYRYSPRNLRLILMDFKMTEFTPYEGLPHLHGEIITTPKKGLEVLKWASEEMQRRLDLLLDTAGESEAICDIESYNAYVGEENKLPYIVIVMDEVADFCCVEPTWYKDKYVRKLIKFARPLGIYWMIASQSLPKDFYKQTNCSTRIAFQVATAGDAQLIEGAQDLLGLGDYIFANECYGQQRLQAPYVSQKEIENVVKYIKENYATV